MILHPDSWQTLESTVGYPLGFAAGTHDPLFSSELRNLAKLLWMIYTGKSNLEELPSYTAAYELTKTITYLRNHNGKRNSTGIAKGIWCLPDIVALSTHLPRSERVLSDSHCFSWLQ